ncbi:sensor histidine kinase [Streptomyces phaeofaciens]|uniref:sensor histidine kinase n=1 Tax=Streptomyces phaeofaciens TaxID=68254 RepID=UPI001E5274C3|nr:ATP-binding protein [Streptomyces phaeofaciens]
MAAALLATGLAVKVAVVVDAADRWAALPQAISELTRLVVGVPVCAVAVLLLADRSGHRAGRMLMAAGAVWFVPSSVLDLVAFFGSTQEAVAAAMIPLGAVAVTVHPLTVLLFPLCFLPGLPSSRGWRFLVTATVAACAVYGAIWTLGTPGAAPFASPWAGTPAGRWAGRHLDLNQQGLVWVSRVVTVTVTADLARRLVAAPTAESRRVWTALALAYPACALLLLIDMWPHSWTSAVNAGWGNESWTMAAHALGGALWVAMVCLVVARGGVWRLERDTTHRLATAFVATTVAAAVVCTAALAWAGLPAGGGAAVPAAVAAALVAGWGARPVLNRASLAVERAFYGPRARPHEAMRALAVRLRQAPRPEEIPEQICRSVVEDLGLSGATVSADTRSGPRLLAAFGAAVAHPKQVFVLQHHGRQVGRLEVSRDGASTPAERDTDLLSLLADQAGPALAALQLGQEAQAARERLIVAREEERRRLRREIHDGLGPQLAAVQMRLGAAQACPAADPQHLRIAAEGLGEALAEVRRITAGLTPAMLAERGLLDATRTLAQRLSTADVQITVDAVPLPLPPLGPAVETAAYRIAAEAVTNAVRHSGARHVRIVFEATATTLAVAVVDDGTGLDTRAVPGTGLASVAERAEEIGGTSTLDTGPHGTTVTATLPTPSRKDDDD